MPKILGKSLIGDSAVSFVDASLISVPNTQIVNRAQIRNLAADLGARAGIERIMTERLIEMPQEVGPSGERVYKAMGDDHDLIRFVGAGWSETIDSTGVNVKTSTSGDFIEIVFFGTDLNLLTLFHAASGFDLRITIDGGAESANIIGTSLASTLNNRSYSPNQVVPVASGLSLGLHTVKIRNAGSLFQYVYGFDIVNNVSAVRVHSGALVKDQRRIGLSATQTISYKPSSLTGTRGGRVVVYNTGGQVFQAVQPVDSSQQNLTSANHSNEEVSKIHYFREFGAGRSDDFSTLGISNSSRSFTLDDGSTTLVGVNCLTGVFSGSDTLSPNQTGNSVRLTFVGTGLDVEFLANTTMDNMTVAVDGVNILTAGQLANATPSVWKIVKIVSGLPYGTHTVSFTTTSDGSSDNAFRKFIVYGPKKPTVPAGAVELADYCVMADYVANATMGIDRVSTGVLRKAGLREFVYVNGTGGSFDWTIVVDTDDQNGARIQTNRQNAYVEYTFFGTGFDFRYFVDSSSSSTSATVSLNGVTLTTANFPTAVTSNYGPAGTSFTAATGILVQRASAGGSQYGSGMTCSGLPLAKYTLRITNNNTTILTAESIDVITPIYAPKNDLWSDTQNTSMLGSCSLNDTRQLIRSNGGLNKMRAVASRNAITGVSTSSTSFVPIPELSLTVPSGGAWFLIHYKIDTVHTGGGSNYVYTAPFVNGIRADNNLAGSQPTLVGGSSTQYAPGVLSTLVYLPVGVHKVDVYWRVNAGTGNIADNNGFLMAVEL